MKEPFALLIILATIIISALMIFVVVGLLSLIWPKRNIKNADH